MLAERSKTIRDYSGGYFASFLLAKAFTNNALLHKRIKSASKISTSAPGMTHVPGYSPAYSPEVIHREETAGEETGNAFLGPAKLPPLPIFIIPVRSSSRGPYGFSSAW